MTEIVVFDIDQSIIDDIKKIIRGYSTSDGIKMLRLNANNNLNNFAGNTYISSLRVIKTLMEELKIDSILYK